MTGIYNHLSALNVHNEDVWWFESPPDQPHLLQLKARHLRTLTARDILELPGRLPIGQSAFSPDGSMFAFIHADAETFYPRYDRMVEKGSGAWAGKALVGLILLLIVLGVVSNLI